MADVDCAADAELPEELLRADMLNATVADPLADVEGDRDGDVDTDAERDEDGDLDGEPVALSEVVTDGDADAERVDCKEAESLLLRAFVRDPVRVTLEHADGVGDTLDDLDGPGDFVGERVALPLRDGVRDTEVHGDGLELKLRRVELLAITDSDAGMLREVVPGALRLVDTPGEPLGDADHVSVTVEDRERTDAVSDALPPVAVREGESDDDGERDGDTLPLGDVLWHTLGEPVGDDDHVSVTVEERDERSEDERDTLDVIESDCSTVDDTKVESVRDMLVIAVGQGTGEPLGVEDHVSVSVEVSEGRPE